jgi:hypothetical protein
MQTYPVVMVLVGLSIANLWRSRREPIRRLLLVTFAFVALTLLSMPAVAHLSVGTLEWGYPPTDQRLGDAQAIVELGGGIYPANAT